MCLLKHRSRLVTQSNFRNELSRQTAFPTNFTFKLMSCHGPWVLAEIFVGGGGGASPKKFFHIEKKAAYKEKKVAERPTHGEKD